MLEASITFYKVSNFGFYNRKSKDPQFGGIDEALQDFCVWFRAQGNLGSTCPRKADADDFDNRNTYCRDIYRDEESGNWSIILWNELSNAEGKIYAVPKEQKVGDQAIKEAKVDPDDILGLPSYFWFSPEKEMFAAIQFKHSSMNVRAFMAYFSDYMKLHSGYRVVEGEKIVRWTDLNGDGKFGKFRFKASRQSDKASRKKLLASPAEITHIIRRASFGKHIEDPRGEFRQKAAELSELMKKMGGYVTSFMVPEDDDSKKELAGLRGAIERAKNQHVDIKVPYEVATESSLQLIFDQYDENFTEGVHEGVGFKMKGDGVVWLKDTAIRRKVELELTASGEKLPSAVEVMLAFNKQKGAILAGM